MWRQGEDRIVDANLGFPPVDVNVTRSDRTQTIHVAVDPDANAAPQKLIAEQIGKKGEAAAAVIVANDALGRQDARRIGNLDAPRHWTDIGIAVEHDAVAVAHERRQASGLQRAQLSAQPERVAHGQRCISHVSPPPARQSYSDTTPSGAVAISNAAAMSARV